MSKNTADELMQEIIKLAKCILMHIMRYEIFNVVPLEVITLVIVGKSFKLKGIPMDYKFSKYKWYHYILPNYEDYYIENIFNEVNQKCECFFLRKRYTTAIFYATLTKWRNISIVFQKGCEQICEPPALSLIESFVEKNDLFSNLWNEHIPTIPPPNEDYYNSLTGVIENN